jgi:signal transduction histidine kinase
MIFHLTGLHPRIPSIPAGSSDSLETLHWLYSVEQRSVIPTKWLIFLLAFPIILIEDRDQLARWEIIAVLGIYAATNILFSWLFLGRVVKVMQLRLWSIPSLAVDVLFVSLMTLLTGRLDSNFFYLFLMPILRSGALFQNPYKKLWSDALMTLVYLGCALPINRVSDPEVTAMVALRVALIWGVILMSFFLVQVLTSQQKRIFAINERLRYQSEQNREVLSSMTDAVMVFDPSQQLRICNRSAEDLLRRLMGVRAPIEPSQVAQDLWNLYWLEPPRVFGDRSHPPWEGGEGEFKFWANLTPDLVAAPVEHLLEEARFKPAGRVDSVPVVLEEKSGQKRSFIASVAAIGQTEDVRLGWLVLLRDISEYKSLEAQLLSAEKLAAVGRLAAGLAHELGNPLGIIKSCANYLKKKLEPGSNLVEEVEVLSSEAERCERILRQLLAFASQEQLRLIDTDLRLVVTRAVNLVAYQAPERVAMDFESPFEIAPCYTDENLLTQAFVNLLLNAVQSIEREGEVKVILEAPSPDSWQVRIRDTGCGMGKETLARMFDPFYTTKPGGTGLGLAITQRIIQRLAGTIAVHSDFGHGSEFVIQIPHKAEDREATIVIR